MDGQRRYNLRERKTIGRTLEEIPKCPRNGKRRDVKTDENDESAQEGARGPERRGTRKRKAVQVDEAPSSATSPDEREIKRPRSFERPLPTPRSESPKAKETSPVFVTPQPPGSPQLKRILEETLIPPEEDRTSGEHAILEPPFEYRTPDRERRFDLPLGSDSDLEFARVLEYV